jgi:dolichyl-phosphate-mannose--protein O-mannosyl transferase
MAVTASDAEIDSAADPGAPPVAPLSAPDRLRPPPLPRPGLGWAVTLAVGAVAAVLRLWSVGFPGMKVFDEIYYTTNAVELLRQGYENNPARLFVVHPPLGKWCIAVGVAIFGNNAYGWRIPSAVAGTVAVVILIRVVRRMTRSTLLAGAAGLLLTLDGLSLVQSRTALLDIYLQVFILAGFACLVIDRDQVRERLAAAGPAGGVAGFGPWLGPRPWRLAGGVLLGASCGVKWSGVWFLAGFAVLSVFWDRGARKSAGARHPNAATAMRDLPGAVLSLVVAPVVTYLLTWTGWFLGENGYERHWADGRATHWGFVPGVLRSLWHYHSEMLNFHEGLSSFHPYRSLPYSWLVDGRPVDYYYPQHVTGCGSKSCVREVLSIGTPALWWAFLPALVWMVWLLVARRDWRAGAVLMAFAAGWGSWLENTERTMFLFYMTPLVPFLIIGITLMLGAALGPPDAGPTRRKVGLLVLCAYLAVVVVNFAWLWPILTGQKITYADWQARMWFSSWI